MTRFPRWDERFHIIIIIIIIVFLDSNDSAFDGSSSLMQNLLFKAQSLPPPTVCVAVGELMEGMWREQHFTSELLRSERETFDRAGR